MADRPRTRQEAYDRIRATSKDQFILEDMIRLGFWPEAGARPDDPADEIRRKTEILQELRSLQTEAFRLQNEKAIREEMRKRKLEESRKKQQETRERNKQRRIARAAAWKERKQRDMLYVGEGCSAALQELTSDAAKLTGLRLPVIHTPLELAKAMGLPLGGVRFLAWNRKVSKTSHYIRFRIPKKTGGERLISAPMPSLKKAQHWILSTLLEPLEVHPCAHGFVRGRSIVTNARPHVGAAVVVNLDLRDFFPTVHWRRARGLFRSFGFSGAVSTLLALICSEAPTDAVELDGVTWHVQAGERHLPQGAPTSPALTNLLCRDLDRRLEALAAALGFTYTRYADDLTFSAKDRAAPVGKLLREVRYLIPRAGFTLHPDKTRVLRQGARREVTGLVVNDKLGVPRDQVRRFRALLHRVERDGPAGCHWTPGVDLLSSMQGFAGFIAMADPVKGRPLLDRVEALVQKHRPPAPKPAAQPAAKPPEPAVPVAAQPAAAQPATQPAPEPTPEPPKPPEPPKKAWWKMF